MAAEPESFSFRRGGQIQHRGHPKSCRSAGPPAPTRAQLWCCLLPERYLISTTVPN